MAAADQQKRMCSSLTKTPRPNSLAVAPCSCPGLARAPLQTASVLSMPAIHTFRALHHLRVSTSIVTFGPTRMKRRGETFGAWRSGAPTPKSRTLPSDAIVRAQQGNQAESTQEQWVSDAAAGHCFRRWERVGGPGGRQQQSSIARYLFFSSSALSSFLSERVFFLLLWSTFGDGNGCNVRDRG